MLSNSNQDSGRGRLQVGLSWLESCWRLSKGQLGADSGDTIGPHLTHIRHITTTFSRDFVPLTLLYDLVRGPASVTLC